MEPRHIELLGPLISTKVPFVRLNLADWMLADHKAQPKDYKLVDRYVASIHRGMHEDAFVCQHS